MIGHSSSNGWTNGNDRQQYKCETQYFNKEKEINKLGKYLTKEV